MTASADSAALGAAAEDMASDGASPALDSSFAYQSLSAAADERHTDAHSAANSNLLGGFALAADSAASSSMPSAHSLAAQFFHARIPPELVEPRAPAPACHWRLLSALASVLFHSVRRQSRRAVWTALLALLLLADCVAVFVTVVEFLPAVPVAMLVFAAAYPAASAAAPLAGFAALVSASPAIARGFVAMNAMSMVRHA